MDDNDVNTILCELLQSHGIDACLKGVSSSLNGRDETYIGIDEPYSDIASVSYHNGTITVRHEMIRNDWSIDLADPDSLGKLITIVQDRIRLGT